jgi:multiple sugar transport system ATP-binding protein
MRTEIKALHARLGATSIYVTHDQVEAMTMADRIVVMSNGNVEQIGAPLDVYDNPTNTFVAGFIGSPAVNLIDGTVRRANDKAVVETSDGMQLPIRSDVALEDGQRVIYGIRPEHIALGDGGFTGNVELIEPTGAETLIFSNVGGIELCARSMERCSVKRGESVGFAPRLDQVLLFDAHTGARQ